MKGDVALIRVANGTVICTVAENPEWQKIYQGEEQCQAVIAWPKKHGPSHKQPHTEMTMRGNIQDNVELPTFPDLPMVPHDELWLPAQEVSNHTHIQPHQENDALSKLSKPPKWAIKLLI